MSRSAPSTPILASAALAAVLLALPFPPRLPADAGDGGGDHDSHAAHRAAAREAGSEGHRPDAIEAPTIPDLPLLDQDGREVRFYRDLVEGRVVAMNFVFTTCTTICPPMGATFAGLQKRLGERLGEEVHLVTVSVDPTVDTPERMREWGEIFHRRDGWTLVTGPKTRVDAVLQALGAFTPEKEDHAPLVLVGNDRTGEWLRVYGLAGPGNVERALERVEGGGTAASGDAGDPSP